jgi:hypothetical protein
MPINFTCHQIFSLGKKFDFSWRADYKALAVDQNNFSNISIINFGNFIIFKMARRYCKGLPLSIKRVNLIFRLVIKAFYWEILYSAIEFLAYWSAKYFALALYFTIFEVPDEVVMSLSESVEKINEKFGVW